MNKIIFFYISLISFKDKLLKIILFEVFYSTINFGKGKSFKEPDIHPTPYYFSYKIAKFINKMNISTVAELGCGFGRITNFLGKKTKAKIYGYEIDAEACLVANKYKSATTTIKQQDITKINFDNLDVECFIMADPFYQPTKENIERQEILIKNIEKSKDNLSKKYYIITVNISESRNYMLKNKNLIKVISAGPKRKIKIYSN
jgi:hypothetical protein